MLETYGARQYALAERYDQSSSTLTGNTFSIWDEQDIYALAAEIAALTKRQQRGKGLRMA